MFGSLQALRVFALVEAVSYLLLVGIAMPLKYAWDMPMAVSVCGMVHGILFLLVVWLAMRAHFERRWPKGRVALLLVASLVPIWPFLLDRRVRQWIDETPPRGTVHSSAPAAR
jgi:integral membrane protein